MVKKSSKSKKSEKPEAEKSDDSKFKKEETEVKTINMGTGNKITRIVAWTFLTKKEQKEWKKN